MTGPKFSVGDRVRDSETNLPGTVVYLYEDPGLKDEILAVKFDVGNDVVAVPIDSIRLVKHISRRKGRQP